MLQEKGNSVINIFPDYAWFNHIFLRCLSFYATRSQKRKYISGSRLKFDSFIFNLFPDNAEYDICLFLSCCTLNCDFIELSAKISRSPSLLVWVRQPKVHKSICEMGCVTQCASLYTCFNWTVFVVSFTILLYFKKKKLSRAVS